MQTYSPMEKKRLGRRKVKWKENGKGVENLSLDDWASRVHRENKMRNDLPASSIFDFAYHDTRQRTKGR